MVFVKVVAIAAAQQMIHMQKRMSMLWWVVTSFYCVKGANYLHLAPKRPICLCPHMQGVGVIFSTLSSFFSSCFNDLLFYPELKDMVLDGRIFSRHTALLLLLHGNLVIAYWSASRLYNKHPV